MANEFKVKNGLIVVGDLTTSGTITINGALAATQSWVTSQAYLTSSSLTSYATQSYVTSAIASLVDSAPGALDTLRELATALGNDASFSTTVTNSIASKQNASTAINTSNIGSQSVSYAAEAGQVVNQTGQLLRYDNRIISPSETTAGYLQFGFTSWANNNTSPYADYLHLRSYTDSSGGSDNLVMFLKSGIGMRIYQQTFGSASAYSSYADVWHSGNLTNLNQLSNGPGYITASALSPYLPLAGGTLTGALSGTSATFSSTVDATGATFTGAGSSILIVRSTSVSGYATTDYYNSSNAQVASFGYGNASVGAGAVQNAAYIYTAAGIDFVGYMGGGERLRIASTGAATFSSTIASGGNINVGGQLTFTPNDSRIISGSSTFAINNNANNTNLLLINNSTGNVGIGTSSPGAKLEIAGFSTGAGLKLNYGNSSGTIEAVNFIANGGANGVIGMQMVSAGVGDLWLGGSGGRSLTLYRDGNVGIGTTAPNATLQVVNTTSGNAFSIIGSNSKEFVSISYLGYLRSRASDTNGANMHFADNGNTKRMEMGVDATSMNWYSDALASHFLTFQHSTGRVGIGTTSPDNRLTVKGSNALVDVQSTADGQTIGFLARYLNSATLGGTFRYTTGDAQLYIDNLFPGNDGVYSDINIRNCDGGGNLINRIKIKGSSGNVGIGTSSPGYKLDVTGDINFTSTLKFGGTTVLSNSGADVYGNIRVLFSNSSINDGMYLNYNSSGGTGAHLRFFANGYTERMRIDAASGNVGIGTESPQSKLHITAGGGDGSAILRITGTASDAFNWASSTLYSNLTVGKTAIHQIGKAESQYNAGHYGYRHTADGSSSNMLTMGMFQADYLVNILGNGNVGIGTTSPSTKLDVSGVITATGGNSTQWNTAYGWGNHASAGYLTSVSDIWVNTAGDTMTGTLSFAQPVGLGFANGQYIKDNGSGGLIISSGAAVGITGTSIAVTGAATFSSSLTVGSRLALQPSNFGYSSSYKTLLIGSAGTDYTTNAVSLAFNVDITGNPSGAFNGSGQEYIWRNAGVFITPNAANTSYNTLFSWNSSGQLTFNQATTLSSSLTVERIQINSSTYEPLSINSSYGQVGLRFGLNGTYFAAIGSANNVTGAYAGSETDLGLGTSGSATANITFATGAGYLRRVTITAAGNVGIGTTSPAEKLSISGTFKSDAFWTTSAGISQWGSYPSAYGTLTWDTGYARIHATGGNRLDLGGGGGLHMSISTTGNVGIGTTTPFYNLDVNGNVGIIGSNFLYFGHGAGNGAWTTRQYSSGSTHKFNAQTFIFNNEGYGAYEHMAITANGINLRAKNTIDSTDSWLRLNQSGDYGSGVYTPYALRNDGAFDNYGGIYGYNTIRGRKAQTVNNYTTAALWTESYDNTTTGIAFHISGNVGKFLEMRTNGILYWDNAQVWTASTLTNLNQLTNGPGYITGYSETDTLNSVTSRGASTSNAITVGATTINGVWQTNISTAGGWSKLSFTASNAWGDGTTYGTLGASGGNEPGVMIYNMHATWAGSGQGAGIRMGRSGGVAGGSWYQVATMDSDEFMIAKNGQWSNGGIKITSGGELQHGNSGNKYWHAGNDGSGSGLDADTVDGLQASLFVRNDTYNSADAGLQVFRNIGTIEGSWPSSDHTFGLENSDAGNIVVNFHRGGYTSHNLRYTGTGFRFDLALESTGVITATGGNSTNWNTAYGWGNHASASYATTSYVTTQINNLIAGAPGALDTLDELAAALGDDSNFATTVTNSIAGKVSKSGDTMTGNLTLAGGTNILFTGGSHAIAGNNTGYLHFYDYTNVYFNNQLVIRGGIQNDGGNVLIDDNLNLSGELAFPDGGGAYSNIIRAAAYPTEGFPTGSNYWMEYRAKGGHHFILNTDGGVGGGANTMDDFVVWQGAIDGNRLLEVSNTGNLWIAGALTEASSIKLKENVETSEGNLEKVVNLRPVTYNKIGSQTTELGLIAEEVATVYPEFVQYDESGEPVGVNYSRLTAALIGAVKELTQRIETLENNG